MRKSLSGCFPDLAPFILDSVKSAAFRRANRSRSVSVPDTTVLAERSRHIIRLVFLLGQVKNAAYNEDRGSIESNCSRLTEKNVSQSEFDTSEFQ